MKKNKVYAYFEKNAYLTLLAFATIGLLLGFLILFFEDFFGIGNSLPVHVHFDSSRPALFKWLASVPLKIMIWFALTPVAFYYLNEIKTIARKGLVKFKITDEIIFLVFITVLQFANTFCLKKYFYGEFEDLPLIDLKNAHLKTFVIINFIGVILCYPFLIAQFRIFNILHKNENEYSKETFLNIKRISTNILYVLSAWLSVIVVVTAFQQEASAEYSKLSGVSKLSFTKEMLYLYSAIYSLILLLTYLPVKMKIFHWTQRYNFTEKDEIKVDWADNFKTIFIILSPLFSSALPSVLQE